MSRSTKLLPLGLTATLAVVGTVAACVFGFRGEVDVAGEANLTELDTVQLRLPPTELSLVGEGSRTFVDWQGTFVSLGGGASDAIATANRAELRWETWGLVGRLSAVLPVEIRDITTLEHLDVESASYLAHEIVGTGSVFVSGIDAYLSIDLAGGDVEILGGTDQLEVRTALGDVDISTSAAVRIKSGGGRVFVEAEAGRDIDIDTVGQVIVHVADASNLDLDIAEAGQLIIDLDTAAHLGSGSYRRTIGTGSNQLRVRSHGGSVEIVMLGVDDTDTDTDTDGETG